VCTPHPPFSNVKLRQGIWQLHFGPELGHCHYLLFLRIYSSTVLNLLDFGAWGSWLTMLLAMSAIYVSNYYSPQLLNYLMFQSPMQEP
jgi:hypothetical protein